ncbi:MAG: STAS domain-containing protein [SAR324 cluster bacterium]|nr:STAS domain-containing protein [SAR324 cluster bacterium]
MEITHQIKDKIGVFLINGILAENKLKQIRKYMDPFMENSDLEGIVVDFKNIEYVDSSGVGMLVAWYRDLKEQQKNLALFQVNKEINKMFKLVGINAMINIFPTEEEALRSCH